MAASSTVLEPLVPASYDPTKPIKPTGTISQSVVSEDPHMSHFTDFVSPDEVQYLLYLAEGNWVRSTVTRGAASTLLTQKTDFKHVKGPIAGAEASAGEPAADDAAAKAEAPAQDPAAPKSKMDVTDEMSKEEIDFFDKNEGQVREVESDRCTSYTFRAPYDDTIVERILARVATVTELPLENIEQLVLVRYGPGQVFKTHHDGAHRPKTVFMYLNDCESGGETYFPHLGFKVRPKQGTAVMWSNIVEGEDGKPVADRRMDHEALPPIGEGSLKIGMNCFINIKRQRDASHIKIVQRGPDGGA